ncbi:MAG: tetracycline efflux MFS transporter TetA(P) [Ktedonobacteraceae bacterium]
MFSRHTQKRQFGALTIYLLMSAVSAFATSTIFAINMVYQVEVVKLNPLQLVLVGTTLEVTCFLCQVPTGALADMYSRRLCVIVGYLLMGVGFLCEGFFAYFYPVLLAQVLWGLGSTLVSGAQEAWCATEIGEQQVGKAFMRGSQISHLATLLSIPLNIGLAAAFQLNAPVIVGGSILLALGLFLLVCMPERHFHPAPPTEHSSRSSWRNMERIMIEGGTMIRHSRVLLVILAVTAFSAMASEGFDRLGIDHFIKDYTFPALGQLPQLTWFGIISAGSALLILPATEIVQRKLDANNQRVLIWFMLGFNVLLVGGVAVFALAGNFYLALGAYWLAGVCRGTLAPLYTTWLIQSSDPTIRATIISMFGQVDAIGQIAGGPGVGYIGTAVSVRAALLTTSAILAPTVPFLLSALNLDRQAPAHHQEESAS